MTPTPDTSPAAVEAMCKMLLDKGPNGGHFVQFGPEAAAMLREVARERDETRAAINRQSSAIRSLRANEESEINILRSRSRDHYIATVTLDSERDANARLTDALLAAEAEAAALREALTKMRGYAVHDDGCGVNALLMPRLPLTKQCTCGLSALIKETSDGL